MNWAASLDISSSVGMGRLIAMGVLAVGACIWDLRFRQIPNFLTAPIAALGLFLAAVDGGWSGGGWALAGLLVGAGLFVLPVALEYVGAGDLKMMAAAGTILGPKRAKVLEARRTAPMWPPVGSSARRQSPGCGSSRARPCR